MNMRKRRKHCAHILGRNTWFREMWQLGATAKHFWVKRTNVPSPRMCLAIRHWKDHE